MKKIPELPDYDITDEMTFEPLSRKNWHLFTELFGERGACGNCWCMYFRLGKGEFTEGKQDDGNKNAMKQLVWDDMPTGLLGIYEGRAIGWCAFAPRADYPKLQRSRVHKPIDNEPVWSVTCFFIDKQFRRMGVSVAMLKGLIGYAREQDIAIIEAYPAIPTQESLPDSFAWIGLYRSFEKAGFQIVDHTSKSRPMVRFYTLR